MRELIRGTNWKDTPAGVYRMANKLFLLAETTHIYKVLNAVYSCESITVGIIPGFHASCTPEKL